MNVYIKQSLDIANKDLFLNKVTEGVKNTVRKIKKSLRYQVIKAGDVQLFGDTTDDNFHTHYPDSDTETFYSAEV